MREKSTIWSLFDTTRVGGKATQATCKYCDALYKFPNATRMTAHIVTKCKKCPQIVSSRYGKSTTWENDCDSINVDEPMTSSAVQVQPASNVASPATLSGLKRPRSAATMDKFVDTVGEDEIAKLDSAAARAVICRRYHLVSSKILNGFIFF